MTHKRVTIRDNAATLLTNQTDAGTRVFKGRANKLWTAELPALLVYTNTERSEIVNEAPREYKRTVELVIEAAVAVTDNANDPLDAIAEQIEAVLFDNDDLNATVDDVKLTDSTIAIVEQGDTTIAGLSMIWEVDYYHYAKDNELLDDLITANTRYNLAGEQHEDDEAEDNVTDLDTL